MLLEVRDAKKQYQNPEGTETLEVLRGVSFQVDAGESVAIVGPSGSGKTTLLNLVGCLDSPSAGAVLFDGRDLSGLSEDELARHRNQSVGFIFQSHHLLPQLSVLENVLVPVLAYATVTPEHEAKARKLLERVGLGGRVEHRPGQLSGGECQRVAFVRALINEPRLILADEPTGALDRSTADGLTELLLELNRESNTAMIVVTHALTLADRMARKLEIADGMIHEA
ncbi:MAG: lipoprotein-releasing system ATP-binding protein [Kiritimatiellia bacterium]|jgi:lipoprotein-releasing system ATP-binding protein